MIWKIENGFLPSEPITSLPIQNYKLTQLIFALENLSCNLPTYLAERRREEIIYELRKINKIYGSNFVDLLTGDSENERMFLLFGMLANGFTNAQGEVPMSVVPKEIAHPLERVAKICDRSPILAYHSYILYNWHYQNGKLLPICTFTDADAEREIVAAFIAAERHLGHLKGNSNEVLTGIECILVSIWNRMDEIKEISGYLDGILDKATVLMAISRLLGVEGLEYNIPETHKKYLSSFKMVSKDESTAELYSGKLNDCISLLHDIRNKLCSITNNW